MVEPRQEEWTQQPPNAQDFGISPPSPPQITSIDKGSVTPPPPSSEKEHAQKELPQQKRPGPKAIEEASKEAPMIEYSQQPSQDVEDQATRSMKIETTED